MKEWNAATNWPPCNIGVIIRRQAACQWFAEHYRQWASESGVFVAAEQLCKQGVPLDIAVSILATR